MVIIHAEANAFANIANNERYHKKKEFFFVLPSFLPKLLHTL